MYMRRKVFHDLLTPSGRSGGDFMSWEEKSEHKRANTETRKNLHSTTTIPIIVNVNDLRFHLLPFRFPIPVKIELEYVHT